MRNKVILIRGWWNLSPEITESPLERINADQVALMTVLRYPQYMPEPWNKFQIDTSYVPFFNGKIQKHLKNEGHEHVLLAQYAEIATEQGLESIRSVEGDILKTDWFYDAVRLYHKSAGQCVRVCTLEYHHKNHAVVANIDGVEFTNRKDTIERLGG